MTTLRSPSLACNEELPAQPILKGMKGSSMNGMNHAGYATIPGCVTSQQASFRTVRVGNIRLPIADRGLERDQCPRIMNWVNRSDQRRLNFNLESICRRMGKQLSLRPLGWSSDQLHLVTKISNQIHAIEECILLCSPHNHPGDHMQDTHPSPRSLWWMSGLARHSESTVRTKCSQRRPRSTIEAVGSSDHPCESNAPRLAITPAPAG